MLPLIDNSEIEIWRKKLHCKKLVLTNGCFDILHVGHVRYLQKARALGDFLLVGLNSDESVRSLKGSQRPINSESDRAEILAALSCVDAVTIFSEPTADLLIQKSRPMIYTKAGDYTPDNLPEWSGLERLKIEVVFVPFETGYSTSSTLHQLQKSS